MKKVSITTTCARLALLAVTAFVAPAAHAIDGNYDTSWGNGGRLQVDVSAGSDSGKTLLIQPDGKLLMAGTCHPSANLATFCATRQLANGSYDASFGPATHPGRVVFSELNINSDQLYGAALTADGGSVFAGYRSPASSNYSSIVQLDAAGSFVASLEYFDGIHINAIAMQPDGKIVVVGWLPSVAGFAIRRITAGWDEDSATFGDGGTKIIPFGTSVCTAEALAIQPDGKIVVAGNVDSKVGVLRLLANGQLDDDPVFGFGDGGLTTFLWGGTQSSASQIKVDHDGSLLVAGSAFIGTGANASDDFFVNRLTPRGRQDSNFNYACASNGGGIICNAGPAYIAFDLGGYNLDLAQTLAVQSDGKILAGGLAQRNDGVGYFAVARRYPDGRPDSSFGDGGQTYGRYGPAADNDDIASALAIGNGGIMIAGASKEAYVSDYRFGIAKLQLDLIFTNGMQ